MNTLKDLIGKRIMAIHHKMMRVMVLEHCLDWISMDHLLCGIRKLLCRRD
jgi:hypothetical protein